MKTLLRAFFAIVFVVLIYVINTNLNKEDSYSLKSSDKDEEYKKMSITQQMNDANKSGNQIVNDSKELTGSSNKYEPEILEALNQHLNTSSSGLTEVKTENSISVDLQGRFQTVPVARINESGELEIEDFTSVPNQRVINE